MKKPILFLDFDGLKFDTLDIHVSYINQRYNIQTVPRDYINNPSIDTVIKKYLPHAQINRESVYVDFIQNFNASLDWHKDVSPIDGAREIIPLLAEKYTLWTVTARSVNSKAVVQYLLDTHLPQCITGIHCVWELTGPPYVFTGVSKKSFIESFEGKKVAFIDDSATEIQKMQEVLPSYLFDPHGLNESTPGIQNKVQSWEEIGNIFL